MNKAHSPFKSDFKFGATLLGDAGFDLSWTKRLHSVIGAAISSKTVSKGLEEALLKDKKKLIFRPIITGFGGTALEPGIPSADKVLDQLRSIVEKGFPVSQVTLYVSPVLPVDWIPALKETFGVDYLATLHYILREAKDIGVTRVFQSFFDIDYLSILALKQIDERLSLDLSTWRFDEFKEISLKVMEPEMHFLTSDPFYRFARQTGIADNEDLEVLGLSKEYRFISPFDFTKNILELITNPAKDCEGRCQICHVGNELKLDVLTHRWKLQSK